jgi:hypothetical protein
MTINLSVIRSYPSDGAVIPSRDRIGRLQEDCVCAPHACEHAELMPQDEQLDVFCEVAAPAADQQPQHSREGEIAERKHHAPMLPSSSIGRRAENEP